MLFVYSFCEVLSYLVNLQIYAVYSSHTTVLCAKFVKDSSTKMADKGK